MLKILAVIGWILLAVLLLLLWIIIVPRSVYVQYTNAGGAAVKVRVLFFKIKVYPLHFGKKTEKSDKPQKKKSKTPKKEKAEDTDGGKKPSAAQKFMQDMPKGMELVKELLSTVKGVMKILLNGIKIKDVSFTLPISAEDAHETQKQYALITNSFYTFSIFLQKYVKIFYKNPVFVADFANLYGDSTYFYCKIQASPSIILAVAFYLFKTYRRITDKASRKEK